MDNLEIIKAVLTQHKVIFGQLKSAHESVNDMEALLRLEKARADLTLNVRQTLSQKRDQLEKIMTPLDQGLRKHYAFEEEHLPPLLGRVLTEALFFEHKQLLSEMEQTSSLIFGIKVEGLTRAKEMEKESLIYERLDNLRRNKLDHLNREEAVLLTLQNVLELQTKVR
jgi:hypothetical protein